MSSPKTSSGLPIAVTLDELARAIDSMGLTPTVSAGLLYHAILQVQAPPYTPRPPTTLAQRKALLQQAMEPPKDQGLSPGLREFVMVKSSPEETTPARLERRRKLMEMAKASFPDGVPDPYTLIEELQGSKV